VPRARGARVRAVDQDTERPVLDPALNIAEVATSVNPTVLPSGLRRLACGVAAGCACWRTAGRRLARLRDDCEGPAEHPPRSHAKATP
jgi:hypothetical protein